MKKQRKHIYKEFNTEGNRLLQEARKREEISPEEIRSGWTKIEQQISPCKNHRTLYLRRIYAAASVCLILIAGGLIYLSEERDSSPLVLTENRDTLPDIIYNDIVLISQDQTLQLEDDVKLEYDSEGRVNFDKERTNLSKNSSEEKEIENLLIVPEGKRAFITLADGTKMHINSGTRVRYPSRFTGEERKISVEGEIFLSVAKNERQPFIVNTDRMDIKVLGTQFNVNAYKDEPGSSVVLVEGAVEVYTNKTEKTLLEPSQRLEFSEGNTEIKKVDPYEYICWIDNIMMLKNRRAGETLNRLARSYGRTIIYEPGIENLSMDGKLDLKDNVEESIEIICLLLKLNHTINQNNEILLTLK